MNYYTRVLNNILMLYKLENGQLYVMNPKIKTWIESSSSFRDISEELTENNLKIAGLL